MSTSLKPCGTRAAYVRHLRHREDPCEPCLKANRERDADKRARHNRARQYAFTVLRAEQPDLFRELLDGENERFKTEGRMLSDAVPYRRAALALGRAFPERRAELITEWHAREPAAPATGPVLHPSQENR